MARSVWKGPYFDITLFKKVKKSKEENSKSPIKTWSRRSTIIPDFVGVTLSVYNGKKFIPVFITEDMVGHKLGEFSPTRVFKGHSGDKKAVQGKR
jgi:small subunit ribosomal protein S19